MARVHIKILNQGWNRVELTRALLKMALAGGHDLVIDFPQDRPLWSNRNGICKIFLEDDEADFLLMIDSDMEPFANPLDLVERDLDMVTFPYPIYRPGTPEPPIVLAVTPFEGTQVDLENKVEEVRRGAGGMMLIARRVVEGLQPPWFMDRLDEYGIRCGDDDIAFCDKARGAGFEIWCAYSHPCDHVKEVHLMEMHAAVKEWRR